MGSATIVQAGEVRLARLESLRAVAALAVLESHVWGWHNAYGPATFASFPAKVLISGDFGVNLFFTLTGFLLFTPFARAMLDPGGRLDLRRYARNRAVRILPLYYVVVATLLVVQHHGGSWDQWWRFTTFSENFLHRTFGTVNGSMWSLVVEVHFYLLLPALAWLLTRVCRARVRRIAALVLALGLGSALLSSASFVPHDSVLLSRSILVDFHFFAAGMLLALVALRWRDTPPPVITRFAARSDLWFVAAIPIFLIGVWSPPLLWVTAIATGLTVAGAALPLRPGVVTRLLETRPLAGLGVRSYSLYLWHLPIVLALRRAPGLDGYLPLLAAATLASCVAAWLSYRLVEEPFLRLRGRWETRAAGSAGGGQRPRGPLVAATALRSPEVVGKEVRA